MNKVVICAICYFLGCFGLLAQDPTSKSRRGSDFTNRELRNAATKLNTYDQGLTAEWLLALGFKENGLRSEAAVEYFLFTVENRTKCNVPEWFRDRVKEIAFVNTESEQTFSSDSLKPEEIAALTNGIVFPELQTGLVFGAQGEAEAAMIASDGVGVSSKLYVLPTGNGQRSTTKASSFPMKVWCPAFVDYNMEAGNGIYPVDVRPPKITFTVRKDRRLVVFGDAAVKFFISVFNLDTYKCELSFVTKERDESACVDCEVAPRRNGE